CLVGRRVSGVVLKPERASVEAHIRNPYQRDRRRAVEFALESHGLPPVGIGTGRGAGRLRVRQVLRDDAHPERLRLESGGRDPEGSLERVGHPFTLVISIPWKDRRMAVLSEKARLTSPAFRSSASRVTELPEPSI